MKDFRFALRTLRSSPGFSVTVIATLALGVGLTTAIFSLVNGVLLRPLPYDRPERIMTLWESNPQLDIAQDRVAPGTYRDWAERSESFEAMGAYNFETFVLTATDEPLRLAGARISPAVLDVVGVPPAVGRAFQEQDAIPGNDNVVLLSDRLWARLYGSDPGIVGSSIVLDDQPFTIVGVMPPRFEFPPDADEIDLWRPLAINPTVLPIRAMRVYNVVGRLTPEASVDRARSEMEAISRGIADENPETNRGWSTDVTPALDQVVGDFTTLATVLAGAAGLVLLIGCVNITNLMLARASVTHREFAIRAALGAGPVPLARRSVAETLTLVTVGGSVGALLAVVGVGVLRRVIPPDLPRVDQIAIDARVLGFAVGASLLSGLVFGLYPAIKAVRPRLLDVLQEGGRGRSGGRAARTFLNAMVVVQVGVALVLLLNAGVMVRSVSRMLAVDPGFRTDDIAVAALSLPDNDFPDRGSQVQFWNALVDRVAALPGVDAAGAVSALPMSPLGIDFDLPISIEGRETSSAEEPRAGYRAVVPGYFEVMGMPLVRGRLLDRFDREEGRPVMLLNETAERQLFPGEDPLGRILGVPMAGSIEIVGVVGDVRHNGLDAPASPELFVAYENFPTRDMHLVVHTEGDIGELVGSIRAEIAALAPALPVTRISTLDELVSESMAQPRFNMALLLGFALCALILAAVGTYGVVSYSVVQRTREIGIRAALGADARRTFVLVVRQTLTNVVFGGLLGVGGALWMSRFVRGLVFEISPLDLPTLTGALLLLVATAAGAAALPATRATRVDPIDALGGD